MELILMSKKLNIIEAMKMPIGTEFEVFSTLNRKADVNMILRENENNKKYLEWVDNEPLKVFEFLMDTTFIPIQQPVSFMEAITSGKRIKCVHDRFSKRDKYITISEMFNRMSNSGNYDFIPTLVNEAKWYIEESEADSNDIR